MYTKIDKVFHALGLVMFASIIVEVTQAMIGRVFDIDDIILNVIGGLIGYGIYALISRIGDSIPKVFKSNWFLNILSILLVIILTAYIWTVVL